MTLPEGELRIRSGAGLGDSLYVQALARELVARGRRVVALTDYPDVFLPLRGRVATEPFDRRRANVVAHYTPRKDRPETDQFTDCCLVAGVTGRVPFVLDWRVTDPDLIAGLRRAAAGRPLVVVGKPRPPMNRTDGFGAALLPREAAYRTVVAALRPHAFVVRVGRGAGPYELTDVDLALESTTVAQLIDVVSSARAVVGAVSFLVPLAECLGRPGLFVWSARGLTDPNQFISVIRPRKVFHRPDLSRAVMDSAPGPDLMEAARALLDAS